AAVCDHTSLATAFAVLQRPVIPMVAGEAIRSSRAYAEDSFFSALVRYCEPIMSTQELSRRVESLERQHLHSDLLQMVKAEVDHLGQSRVRLVEEYLEVLRYSA